MFNYIQYSKIETEQNSQIYKFKIDFECIAKYVKKRLV